MRNAYSIPEDRQEGYELGFDPNSDRVMIGTFVRASYYQAMVRGQGKGNRPFDFE
jgi:hypothetical protein